MEYIEKERLQLKWVWWKEEMWEKCRYWERGVGLDKSWQKRWKSRERIWMCRTVKPPNCPLILQIQSYPQLYEVGPVHRIHCFLEHLLHVCVVPTYQVNGCLFVLISRRWIIPIKSMDSPIPQKWFIPAHLTYLSMTICHWTSALTKKKKKFQVAKK